MTRRAAVLAARRDLLVARSEFLRADLHCEAAVIGQRLRFVDRAAAFARSRPGRVLLVAGAAVLLLTGPRKWFRVAGRLAAAWPLLRPWLLRSSGSTR